MAEVRHKVQRRRIFKVVSGYREERIVAYEYDCRFNSY
jgi:hypothetical protein